MEPSKLCRTAAIIYSDQQPYKTNTIKNRIVETIFIENDNKELDVYQVIECLKEEFKLDFQEDDILELINDTKHTHYEIKFKEGKEQPYIRLQDRRFALLQKNENENEISRYIELFCEEIYENHLKPKEVEESIYKFLYEILNKNIYEFVTIINANKNSEDINLHSNLFSVGQREAINSFLDWSNEAKNRAIFALVSYSIEYSLISNNISSSQVFIESLGNKIFYLDNNILYRAIGINSENRKKRILTFLDKCLETGQKLVISRNTYEEFRNSIKYHVSKIQKFPFKSFDASLFDSLAVDTGIYRFYHNWKSKRSTYGFELFESYIMSLFDDFKLKYKIEVTYDNIIKADCEKDQEILEDYHHQIQFLKGVGAGTSKHDAYNVYLIEKQRDHNNVNLIDTKYYFVSTDQKLRNWDLNRNSKQPVVILPSQWMAILLKYHSRSSDDYKSFVSFLKLKTSPPPLSEEKLHTVLAGISEITQDCDRQKTILDRMVDQDFRGVVNSNNIEDIYQNSIEFAEKELEKTIGILNKESEYNMNLLNVERSKNQTLILENKKFLEMNLQEKKDSINSMTVCRVPLNEMINKKHRNRIIASILFGLIYIATIIIVVIRLEWDKIEKYTYLFSVIYFAILYLIAAIFGQNFDLRWFLSKERIEENVYKKFNFNKKRFCDLEKSIKDLENKITELECEL